MNIVYLKSISRERYHTPVNNYSIAKETRGNIDVVLYRRMTKINWSNRINNEELYGRGGEKRDSMDTAENKGKMYWAHFAAQ
jgi:hypothetical protein